MSRILFVYTSASQSLQGNPTGWYLPEAAHPYYVLAPHFSIDFTSPKGPNPPIDPSSVEVGMASMIRRVSPSQRFSQNFKDDSESQRFLNDPDVKTLFANAKPLRDVNANDYVAIFYVGGHGPVIDLAFDDDNSQLAEKFYRSGKIVSAVCHGTAALNGVSVDGKSIFEGKVVTGFSTAEEKFVGKVQDVPFLLEERIIELGGTFEKADELFGVKVVHSGNLITGQNPASARPLAEEILKALQASA
ncbi:ThiJ/PfpI [Gloeopeniophorella convolvens]|nr:ThiJ/PfpI [Gloeopeniophorella convolvens]